MSSFQYYSAPTHGEGNVLAKVDASVREEGNEIGLIVTYEEGNFMFATTKLHNTTLDPKVGETLTLFWAIELLWELHVTHVDILSDCLNLVQAWNRRTPSGCS
ncbi:hypothetical protein RIF29_29452 [Crotalaria pallida]|uniref:RNase H type-1 domain-containing protein n=1 Tax=Crotalaria pallida TaxID=3830 RepID=A0AAN9EGY0_CROPI